MTALQLVVIGDEQPCSECGEAIEPGQHAFWLREDVGRHHAWHLHCDEHVRAREEGVDLMGQEATAPIGAVGQPEVGRCSQL